MMFHDACVGLVCVGMAPLRKDNDNTEVIQRNKSPQTFLAKLQNICEWFRSDVKQQNASGLFDAIATIWEDISADICVIQSLFLSCVFESWG